MKRLTLVFTLVLCISGCQNCPAAEINFEKEIKDVEVEIKQLSAQVTQLEGMADEARALLQQQIGVRRALKAMNRQMKELIIAEDLAIKEAEETVNEIIGEKKKVEEKEPEQK